MIKAVRSIVDYTPRRGRRFTKLWPTRVSRGNKDKAIEVLELILKNQPDQIHLRVRLAELLAKRGDTGKLLLQIEELKRLGHPPSINTIFHSLLSYQYKSILEGPTDPCDASGSNEAVPPMRVQVEDQRVVSSVLQGVGGAGDAAKRLSPGPQRQSARSDSQVGWTNNLISQGDTDGAIKEYRALVKQVPRFVLMLARLLIGRISGGRSLSATGTKSRN